MLKKLTGGRVTTLTVAATLAVALMVPTAAKAGWDGLLLNEKPRAQANSDFGWAPEGLVFIEQNHFLHISGFGTIHTTVTDNWSGDTWESTASGEPSLLIRSERIIDTTQICEVIQRNEIDGPPGPPAPPGDPTRPGAFTTTPLSGESTILVEARGSFTVTTTDGNSSTQHRQVGAFSFTLASDEGCDFY